ncbi:hypothetical protein PPROV_000121900 [Pycnococcus provasolii]|uniref:NADH dehydrogenase [ubiquinone] iron-sulfur protein 5 n=1 Tax=Pycnococcus provasolii TaxID=41880 RepID=A0A830H7A3_9CHLO|nr:hypothetical protein PPROV_000121900 [Pycnococcus provasolii]
MASGFGLNGNVGRCYKFWQDFSKCAVEADMPGDCRILADDYFECLHHKKEYARYNEIAKREKELKAQGKAPPRPDYST